MSARRIRILLVDDHPVVREGLCSCLARYPHLQVVGEADDGAQALLKARTLTPDVVLMDINLPHMNGLDATRHLHQQMPAIKVLVLTIYDNPEYVLEIIRTGAQGYVLKNTAPQELVDAIEKVHRGETFFSPSVAQVVINDYVARVNGEPARSLRGLSPREREVLVLITEGNSSKDVARRLGVAVRTIDTHRGRIMRKLDVHNIAGLTKFAIAHGLIKLP